MLDEPTSSLDVKEVAELMAVIRQVRDKGVAVLFVSHFLDQTYQIVRSHHRAAQRGTGRRIPDARTASAAAGVQDDRQGFGGPGGAGEGHASGWRSNGSRVVRFCPQRASAGQVPSSPTTSTSTPVRWSVWPVCSAPAAPNSSGCCTAPTAATAAPPPSPAEDLKLRSPRLALDQKIAFASENRKAEGLISDLSVRANIVLAMQAERGWVKQIPAASAGRGRGSLYQGAGYSPRQPGDAGA